MVLWIGGLGVGQTFTHLRKRWRSDFVGREARVTTVRGSMARVVVDGVPYAAYLTAPVARGDRVVLTGTDLGGVPIRADFMAQKAGTADLPSSAGGS